MNAAIQASLAQRDRRRRSGLSRQQVQAIIDEQQALQSAGGDEDFDLLVDQVALAADTGWLTVDVSAIVGSATRVGLKALAESGDGEEVYIDVRKDSASTTRILHYHVFFEANGGDSATTGYGTCPLADDKTFQYQIRRSGTVDAQIYLDEAY